MKNVENILKKIEKDKVIIMVEEIEILEKEGRVMVEQDMITEKTVNGKNFTMMKIAHKERIITKTIGIITTDSITINHWIDQDTMKLTQLVHRVSYQMYLWMTFWYFLIYTYSN